MKRMYLLFAIVLLISTMCFAQTVRNHKIEKDGFEWYQIIIDNRISGAEDKYGNTIIPTIHTVVDYATYCGLYETHRYFWVSDWDINTDISSKGIYDRSGRCIIPTSRHYTWIEKSTPLNEDETIGTIYYCWKGNEHCIICDAKGKEICSVRFDGTYKKNCYVFPYYREGVFYLLLSTELGYGIADGTGNIIIEPTHEYISLSNGNFIAENKVTGKKEVLGKVSSLSSTSYLFAHNYIEGPDGSVASYCSTSNTKSSNANASNNSSSSSNVATSNEEHIISYDYYKSPSGNKIKGNYKFNIQFKNDAVYFKLTNTKKGNIIYNFKLKELYYSEVDNVLMIGFKDSKKSHVFLFKKGYYDPVEHIETNLITNKETITSYFQDKEDATSVLGMTILMGTTPTEIFFDRIFEELSFYQGGCKIRLIDK